MKGFTQRALIRLSSAEEYAQYSAPYRYSYKLAIANLVAYLKSVDIEHDCLITDKLATQLDMHHPRWLATGAAEDMFFAHKFCGVPAYDTHDLTKAQAEQLRKKFPIERGLEPAERFKIVQKRVDYMEKKLTDSYDFVVVFGNRAITKSKPGDGRAIMRVRKNFCATMELSGEEVPINDFLQVPYGMQSLSEWGKYNGN